MAWAGCTKRGFKCIVNIRNEPETKIVSIKQYFSHLIYTSQIEKPPPIIFYSTNLRIIEQIPIWLI